MNGGTTRSTNMYTFQSKYKLNNEEKNIGFVYLGLNESAG